MLEEVKAREGSSIIYEPIYDSFMCVCVCESCVFVCVCVCVSLCVCVCVFEGLGNPRCPLLKFVEAGAVEHRSSHVHRPLMG